MTLRAEAGSRSEMSAMSEVLSRFQFKVDYFKFCKYVDCLQKGQKLPTVLHCGKSRDNFLEVYIKS